MLSTCARLSDNGMVILRKRNAVSIVLIFPLVFSEKGWVKAVI